VVAVIVMMIVAVIVMMIVTATHRGSDIVLAICVCSKQHLSYVLKAGSGDIGCECNAWKAVEKEYQENRKTGEKRVKRVKG
jgi:hypothetical protein